MGPGRDRQGRCVLFYALSEHHISGLTERSIKMENRSILLVEDNPSDVNLTRRALEKQHVANDLIVAKDGQEALDYLFGPGPNLHPGIILLDLKLPKIDGITVLKKLKTDERTKKIPVVILTTSSDDRDLEDCYSFGANSYICKPVDFNKFSDVVARLGMYWLVLNELPSNDI